MPQLTDLLAQAPLSFIKDADVESPDEVQLEQDFANMAFVFLRDRAPGLMPHLLGFEVVDREEDGSRAVGIFGFKISGSYYYVPAFFVNKQIKGMDLLFSKKTNSFVPLRETWINHIIDRAAVRLGDSAGGGGQNKLREDFESPNFEFLANPPGAKMARDMSKVAEYLAPLDKRGDSVLDFVGNAGSALGDIGESASHGKWPLVAGGAAAAGAAGYGAYHLYKKHKADKTSKEVDSSEKDEKAKKEKQAQSSAVIPGRPDVTQTSQITGAPMKASPVPGAPAAPTPVIKPATGKQASDATARIDELRARMDTLSAEERAELANLETPPEPGAPESGNSLVTDDSKVAWVRGQCFPIWNDLQGAVKEAAGKDPEFRMALAGAIATLKRTTLDDFEKTADGSPIFAYLQRFGGLRAVHALAKTAHDNFGFASALLHFYPSVTSLVPKEYEATAIPKQAAVTVEAVESGGTMPADMGEKDRKRVVRDGFALVDRRPSESKSETFDVVYDKQYSNPTEGGLYELLLPSGAVAKAWVLPPAGNQPGSGFTVVEPSKRFYFTADSSRVFVRGGKQDGKTPYESASSLDSIKPGSKYVLIDERGNASAPFSAQAVMAENGERVRIKVCFHAYVDHRLEGSESGYGRSPYTPDPDYLQLAPIPNGRLRTAGQDLIVPENWKAIKLIDKYDYSDSCCKDCDDRSGAGEAARTAYDAFKPGSPLDVEEALGKNAVHRLTVENPDGGSDYYVDLDGTTVGPYGYRRTLTQLVTKLGMDVDDAEQRMQDAVLRKKARCLIKFAQYGGVGVGINMPQDPGYVGSDPDTGALMQQPFSGEETGQLLGVPPTQDPSRPGFAVGGQTEREIGNGGGQGSIGEDAVALAQQAAQAGQKNVFDHATIGGLARMYDASAAVDQYLPDLLKALDRLGRVLFIFYWKNEDFAERYGQEDLAEMEDLFRGVFKSFGDLVLKLKQKSVATEDNKEMLAL